MTKINPTSRRKKEDREINRRALALKKTKMYKNKIVNVIASGAEAVIIQKGPNVIKKRVPKGYRHPQLDLKLRSRRTRTEARLLEKAAQVVHVPKLIKVDERSKELILEKIKGKKLASSLDKLNNKSSVAKKIGKEIAKLHDANIIHGDLTTSNLLLKGTNVFIIDFGLGFASHRVEDKAVDIHVFKEALEAKHPMYHKTLGTAFIEGYNASKNARVVLKQLEKVEKRGRYKTQY